MAGIILRIVPGPSDLEIHDPPRPLIAVYPGSFDPITGGHMEVIVRALRLFDRVIVAVGKHPTKPGFFTVEERVALIAESVKDLAPAGKGAPRVVADQFTGLVVEYCKAKGAQVLLRGLRAHGDFEPEFQMALANRDLAPELETVFLIPRPERQIISSSLVREIATHGGDFSRYVPAPVFAAVQAKLKARST